MCVCVCVCVFSHVQLFVTPWIIACQAHLSMGFSRQEYWSGLPFLFLGIFPTQGLNPGLLHCRNHQMQLYISNILYPATDVLFDVNERAGKNSSLNPIAQVLGAPQKWRPMWKWKHKKGAVKMSLNSKFCFERSLHAPWAWKPLRERP